VLARRITPELSGKESISPVHDSSTRTLIGRYREAKEG